MLSSVAAPEAGRTVEVVEVDTANNVASITAGLGKGALGVSMVVVVEEVGATESATSVTASTARRVHASQVNRPYLCYYNRTFRVYCRD